jgi:uncharacterized protein YhaN
MKAFGKFHQQTIDIEPGLNLIQGNNEAGKTTIQVFIQGMFFGFFKPYRKKKTYSKEYEKYMPWNQFDYSGAIVYATDNQEIRIERNFLRGKDSLHIFDSITGKEVTENYPYDGVVRQHLPLANQGMTIGLYNNTFNSRQIPTELDQGTQEEIRECYLEIQNMTGTEINFNGIFNRLEEKKKKIGKSGQSKSRLGLAIRKREKLLISLKEAEVIHEKVRENQDLISTYQKRMKENQNQNEYNIKKEMVNQKKELLKTYERIETLEKDNRQLGEKVKALVGNEQYNEKTLEGLKALDNQVQRLDDQMHYIEKEMDELESQIKIIRQKEELKRQNFHHQKWETIADDYEIMLRNQTESEPIKKQPVWIMGILATLFLLSGIALGVIYGIGSFTNSFILISGIILGGMGIIGLIMTRTGVRKNRNVHDYVIINPIQQAILIKYKVETIEEFEFFYKKASKIHKELDQLKNEVELLTVQQAKHQAGYEVLFEQKRSIVKEYAAKLFQNGVKTLEAYRLGCKKADDYHDVKSQYTNNYQLLEELYKIINAKDQLKEKGVWKKETLESQEMLELGNAIASIEGKNNSLIEGTSPPIEIIEEIKTLDTQIQAWETEIQGCEAALEILNKIQKEYHHESVPELNQRIGDVLGEITNKYDTVKIDESLKLKIVEPQSGDFKNTEKLSAGTMDQVHFAFRYGMSGILNNEMPFILDEPFVRYDQKRKTQALKLLGRLSKQRQVILFTCGNDERKILENLEVPVNIIQL